MAGGDPGALALLSGTGDNAGSGSNGAHRGETAAAAGWEPVWIETPECTACDECVNINPKIFRYNGDKKAEVADPKAGPSRTSSRPRRSAPPGASTPARPGIRRRPGLDKLMKRAEKYQ